MILQHTFAVALRSTTNTVPLTLVAVAGAIDRSAGQTAVTVAAPVVSTSPSSRTERVPLAATQYAPGELVVVAAHTAPAMEASIVIESAIPRVFFDMFILLQMKS